MCFFGALFTISVSGGDSHTGYVAAQTYAKWHCCLPRSVGRCIIHILHPSVIPTHGSAVSLMSPRRDAVFLFSFPDSLSGSGYPVSHFSLRRRILRPLLYSRPLCQSPPHTFFHRDRHVEQKGETTQVLADRRMTDRPRL